MAEFDRRNTRVGSIKFTKWCGPKEDYNTPRGVIVLRHGRVGKRTTFHAWIPTLDKLITFQSNGRACFFWGRVYHTIEECLKAA